MTTRRKPQNDHTLYRDSHPYRENHHHQRRSSRHSNQTYSYEEEDHSHHDSRLKGLKNHFVASSGEFVGTFMFLFFAFAAHLMIVGQGSDTAMTNGGPSAQTIVFISLAYGFSLLVTVWGWYRVSGGLFNPAVTLGLVVAGALPWLRGVVLLPAQLLGGMAAAGVVSCLYPGDIAIVNTTLAPGTSIVQGVFIEMFLTSLLVYIVLMLAAEKSRDTFIAPIGIGLALFVAELAGVYYTGGSLNPTRSFGPAVASLAFVGYHWIYWVGPCLGAVIAALYFRMIKYLNYEEANPGQDAARE